MIDTLIHDSPTMLRTRPTVAIRAPGKVTRIPARSGTLLLLAVLVWGLALMLTSLEWDTLAGIILGPAGVLAALVELKPHGKPPLAWAYVLARHLRRAPVLAFRRRA